MRKFKLICMFLCVILTLSFSSCSCQKQERAKMFPDEPEPTATVIPLESQEEAASVSEAPSQSTEESGEKQSGGKVLAGGVSGDAEKGGAEAGENEKNTVSEENVKELTKGYNVIKKAVSPDGSHIAYVFKRKSTSTGTDLYNLSILKAGEPLTGDHGNTFSIGYLFDVKWADASSLLVSVRNANDVGLVQETKIDGIDVFYGILQ